MKPILSLHSGAKLMWDGCNWKLALPTSKWVNVWKVQICLSVSSNTFCKRGKDLCNDFALLKGKSSKDKSRLFFWYITFNMTPRTEWVLHRKCYCQQALWSLLNFNFENMDRIFPFYFKASSLLCTCLWTKWLLSLSKFQVSKDKCQSQVWIITTCDMNYAYLIVTVAQ